MDTTYTKERNYRIVETLRQQNLREQRRHNESINGRLGLMKIHNNQIASVAKEQAQIKRELAQIRQTTTTTWGLLPPRLDAKAQEPDASPRILILPLGNLNSPLNSQQMENTDGDAKKKGSRKLSKAHEKNDQKQKETEDRLRAFSENYPIESDNKTPPKTGTETNENTELTSDQGVKNVQQKHDNKENDHQTKVAKNQSDINDKSTSKKVSKKRTKSDKPTEPRRLKRPPNPKPDMSKTILADFDDAKDNIAKRLIQKTGETDDSKSLGSMNTPFPYALTPIEEKPEPKPKAEKSENQNITSQGEKRKSIKKDADDLDYDVEEELAQFTSRYNGDGSLRTMFMLPDFQTSLNEAKKAHYVRHRPKAWFEKELSVGQIFAKE